MSLPDLKTYPEDFAAILHRAINNELDEQDKNRILNPKEEEKSILHYAINIIMGQQELVYFDDIKAESIDEDIKQGLYNILNHISSDSRAEQLLNWQDELGDTALHYAVYLAAKGRDLGPLERLTQINGVDPNIKDQYEDGKWTPFVYAMKLIGEMESEFNQLGSELNQLEKKDINDRLVNLLMENRNFSIYNQDEYGQNAMHHAAAQFNQAAINKLLGYDESEKKNMLCEKGKGGFTPLHTATYHYSETRNSLRARRTDEQSNSNVAINLEDPQEKIVNKKFNIILDLLSEASDKALQQVDNENNTLLDIAIIHGCDEGLVGMLENSFEVKPKTQANLQHDGAPSIAQESFIAGAGAASDQDNPDPDSTKTHNGPK